MVCFGRTLVSADITITVELGHKINLNHPKLLHMYDIIVAIATGLSPLIAELFTK